MAVAKTFHIRIGMRKKCRCRSFSCLCVCIRMVAIINCDSFWSEWIERNALKDSVWRLHSVTFGMMIELSAVLNLVILWMLAPYKMSSSISCCCRCWHFVRLLSHFERQLQFEVECIVGMWCLAQRNDLVSVVFSHQANFFVFVFLTFNVHSIPFHFDVLHLCQYWHYSRPLFILFGEYLESRVQLIVAVSWLRLWFFCSLTNFRWVRGSLNVPFLMGNIRIYLRRLLHIDK